MDSIFVIFITLVVILFVYIIRYNEAFFIEHIQGKKLSWISQIDNINRIITCLCFLSALYVIVFTDSSDFSFFYLVIPLINIIMILFTIRRKYLLKNKRKTRKVAEKEIISEVKNQKYMVFLWELR